MLKFILLVFLFIITQTVNSYAYLDPGTGSFILQAIIGFIAAGLATVTLYWNKFKNFISKKFKKKNKDN